MTSNRTEVLGIKPWKRWQIDCFLQGDGGELHYARTPGQALLRQARHGSRIVVWAAREPEGLAEAAAAQGAQLVRIEDGFLRSSGLGSNHVAGASLVVDAEGIYFDPRRPSRLERLLQHGSFDEQTLLRARALRQYLVRNELTKYNVGSRSRGISAAAGRRRLLVPGQVEGDASIRYGSPLVNNNLELLRRVREAEPGAWIVYKPHPDTEAGTRPGRVDESRLRRYADEIVWGVSPTALFGQVDAVHTMTSLLGFEALLRGIPVVTWGQPFYAGWGLTEDRLPPGRRTRRLELDMLVAGALLHYPLYADLRRRRLCTAEEVAQALASSGPVSSSGQQSAVRRYTQLMQGLHRSWSSVHARN